MSEVVGFVGVGSAVLLGWGTVLWRISSGHSALSERHRALEKNFNELRSEVKHVLDNGTFPRMASFNALVDRLKEDREAVAEEFKSIREMQQTDRLVFERRFNDHSRRMLSLAKAAGLQTGYDDEVES